MEVFFWWVFFIPGAYLGLLAIYTFVIVVASWLHVCSPVARLGGDFRALPVAVLIPAHNEKDSIAATIRSIRSCTYSGGFKVFVIADNCSDDTAVLAQDEGAEAWERFDTNNPGKGQAINWALSSYADVLSQYEYVTFVDADTEVDPDFLTAVSMSLAEEGVNVVQGFHGVLNAESNWRTSFVSLGFAGVNHIRPAGRSFLNGSAGITGNGMAFRRHFLLEFGWPAHSIVEDLEITLKLLLSDCRVRYNGRAVVKSEMPLSTQQADSQRERWEGGRHQIAKQYLWRFMSKFLTTGRWIYLDAVLDLLLPPFTLMLMGAFVATALGWGLEHNVLLGAGIAGLAVTAFYSVSALLQTKASCRVWVNLAAAPFFLLWKIPLSIKLLRSKQNIWKRTVRNSEK